MTMPANIPAGGTPPAQPPVAEPPVAVPPAPAAAPAPYQAPAPTQQSLPLQPPASPETEPKVLGRGGQEMNAEAIKERTERERKKVLREAFGTDDPTEIEKIKAQRQAEADELTRLKKQEEERKRAAMSEQERLQADIATLKAENEQLKAKLAQAQNTTMVEKQDTKVAQIASRYLRMDKELPLKTMKRELAEHFQKLSKTAQKMFGERELKKWVEDFVKENPEFSKQNEPQATSPNLDPNLQANLETQQPSNQPKPAPPGAPRRAPITTGRRPVTPPPKPSASDGPGMFAGKTVLPGKPNSMNKRELQDYLKQRGQKSW